MLVAQMMAGTDLVQLWFNLEKASFCLPCTEPVKPNQIPWFYLKSVFFCVSSGQRMGQMLGTHVLKPHCPYLTRDSSLRCDLPIPQLQQRAQSLLLCLVVTETGLPLETHFFQSDSCLVNISEPSQIAPPTRKQTHKTCSYDISCSHRKGLPSGSYEP